MSIGRRKAGPNRNQPYQPSFTLPWLASTVTHYLMHDLTLYHLYSTVPCPTLHCRTLPYRTVLYPTLPYSTLPFPSHRYPLLYPALPYPALTYTAVPCSTLHCTVLYSSLPFPHCYLLLYPSLTCHCTICTLSCPTLSPSFFTQVYFKLPQATPAVTQYRSANWRSTSRTISDPTLPYYTLPHYYPLLIAWPGALPEVYHPTVSYPTLFNPT